MTREKAIQAYTGPLEPTVDAWWAWRAHLAALYRKNHITFEEAVGAWDPPQELQGFTEGMQELEQARKDRAYLRRKGRRAQRRKESRLEERVERMRERKP